MKLPFRVMPFCLVAALVLAPVPSSAQSIPQVLRVEAVPNIGFSGEFSWGHVAISADSKLVVSARGTEVKLWNLATERLLRTMNGHTKGVTALMFSPDSKRMLSGSHDKSVKLWDLATGRVIRTFEDHADTVNAVAFSADGSRMLSASDDKTVKLWDIATGQLLRTFTGHSDKVSSVTFSPDGRRVLSGSDDDTARLWDVATGRLVRTFPVRRHATFVRKYWTDRRATVNPIPVAYLPDGERIAIGGGSVALWDAASGKLLRTFEPSIPEKLQQFFGSAESLAVSADGSRIVAHIQLAEKSSCILMSCPLLGSTIKSDRATIVWDVTTGQQLRIRMLDSKTPLPAVSSDGAQLLTESSLEDIVTGKVVREFHTQNSASDVVALSPNGGRAAMGNATEVSIWSISTGQLLRMIKHEAEKRLSVVFSRDGNRVLTANEYYTRSSVTVWDVANGQLLKSFDMKGGVTGHTTFSLDRGSFLRSQGDPDFVELWDLSTGALKRRFKAREMNLKAMAVSPHGTHVAIDTYDRITLWDAATGELLREIDRNKDDFALEFSPDGTKLMAANGAYSPSSVAVWDVRTGQLLLEVKVLSVEAARDVEYYAWTATFSPDSKRIIVRDYSKTVKQWDITTKQLIRSINVVGKIPGSSVHAISADATRVLLGTNYGGRVWSMETGELLVTLVASKEGEWVAFSPEGYFDGSKNAADMFTVVHGLDIIDRDQVEKTLRRPDLLQQELKGVPIGRP